eukprot:jgi/Phyca11/13137/fgenesh1_pg.PHYCAscaffold_2_\
MLPLMVNFHSWRRTSPGYEPKLKRLQYLRKQHYNNKMPPSSDSEEGRRKKNKEFHINSSGNPVHWDGGTWPFYRKAMTVAFQRDLLEQIATGKVKEDNPWSQDEKDEHTKKQAKVQMLIMGSRKTTFTQQLMDQTNGTDIWAGLCKTYEGGNNDATKAQKVYRLQGELHRTHLRANGDMRGHLFTMFRIRNELAELGLKKQGHASGNQKCGNNKYAGDVLKKKIPKTDIECFNCGVKGYYKSNCPDLEEKSNTKKPHRPRCMKDSDWNPTISGFGDGVGAQAEGFETILLASMIDEEMVFVFVEDVLMVQDSVLPKTTQWDRMVQASVLPTFGGEVSSTPNNKLADNDQQVWQDMLENIQTQEGESEVNTEAREHDNYRGHGDRDHGDVDDDHEDHNHGDVDDAQDEESVDYEHGEVASHVTDLVSVSENIVDDENGYNFVFDLSDEHEAESDASAKSSP